MMESLVDSVVAIGSLGYIWCGGLTQVVILLLKIRGILASRVLRGGLDLVYDLSMCALNLGAVCYGFEVQDHRFIAFSIASAGLYAVAVLVSLRQNRRIRRQQASDNHREIL